MLKIENISKSYGLNSVLNNFSCNFEKNQRYYINGVSGAGKTTLFRIIMGLDTPDSGNIFIEDDKKISVVFQEYRLLENLSVFKNISLVTGKSKSEIMHNLEIFGIEKFANMPVSTLSGGMKQRVSLLRAMLFEHDILLLDEPFKGIDCDLKEIIIQEINKLHSTIILTTHLKDEAIKLNITTQIDLKKIF